MRAPAALLAAALLVGGGGATACGSDSSGTTAEDPAPRASSSAPSEPARGSRDEVPECTDVWQTGTRLPTGYRGCTEEGEPVRTDRIRCSFGLVIVTYADRYYAVPGDQINEVTSLREDPDFRRTVNSCQA